MNGRQRRVLQFLAVVLVAMILFPPVRTGYGYLTGESYAFIFALPFRSSVNVGLLLVQWLFAGAVGGIAFVLSKVTDLLPTWPHPKHNLVRSAARVGPRGSSYFGGM